VAVVSAVAVLGGGPPKNLTSDGAVAGGLIMPLSRVGVALTFASVLGDSLSTRGVASDGTFAGMPVVL